MLQPAPLVGGSGVAGVAKVESQEYSELARLFSQEIDAAKSELRVNKREADEPDVCSPLIWASPGAPFPAPWAPALVSLVPGKAQQGLRVRIDRRSVT